MTDDAATEATTPDGKSTFVIVPTLDGYLDLAQRLEELEPRVVHLEAATPATGDDDDTSDADIDQLHDRLDRHRNEIEQVKRVINQIIKFLGSSGIPASPPAEGQDTMQPQNRNLMQ